MTTGGDPAALGQLLRSRRERLAPADVGLPAGQRRRTAGLRREEVALLASLSTTYYTFLEQGRPVRPSAQVLDALAAALRMSAAERRYLHVLAYGPGGADGSGPAAPAPPERLDPADPAEPAAPTAQSANNSRAAGLAASTSQRRPFTTAGNGSSRCTRSATAGSSRSGGAGAAGPVPSAPPGP